MQDYEYKDEGGRFLCRLHHRIRCDECHYVSDLRDENKRYREALEFYADERNYKERDFGMIIQPAIQDGDKGNTAREALEEIK